jgi:catechol 2,3-dioxygenase-like lactoylglutathione lyase family enzyme
MATVQVRYIVHDVDAAATFYCQRLGFEEVMRQPPGFAMLVRGDLRLVLSAPGAPNTGGGSTLPDGRKPEPGGWNRFAVEVSDVTATVERLSEAGVRLRSGVIRGRGGNQAIIEDPSGNPIELFEPTLPEARLAPSS